VLRQGEPLHDVRAAAEADDADTLADGRGDVCAAVGAALGHDVTSTMSARAITKPMK
jgi:hypothetical protein